MTYITIVGDQDEYATLWTGGANYAGTMDPGRFHTQVVSNTHEVSIVDAERKYFDWQASDKYGIAIYRPLTSGARRNTVPTGYKFGAYYGASGGMLTTNSQSSGSSSERNGTHVGPGGTSSGNGEKTMQKMVKPIYRKGRDPCPPGYRLRTVDGKRMCVIQ